MRLAILLLAAGRSERFGPEDKLLAQLDGRPLINHAANAARAVDATIRIAVVSNPALHPHIDGFDIVVPDTDAPSQSDSLRAGLSKALEQEPDKILVLLGDMPGVTPDLLHVIIQKATSDLPAAATDGTNPMPPACFPRSAVDQLLALSGDRGARALLRDLPASQLVQAAPQMLRDIDRPSDLATMEKRP